MATDEIRTQTPPVRQIRSTAFAQDRLDLDACVQFCFDPNRHVQVAGVA